MNVKIKTVYGELQFSMSNENALALISTAIGYSKEYADSDATDADKRNDALPALAYAADAIAKMAIPPIPLNGEKKPNAPPEEKPAPKSRLEKLFGEKADWKMPTESSPKEDTESGAEDEPEEYRGFMYVECEKCGTRKGFCVKSPITYHKCECGHETKLHGLRPAHVKCECNSRFTYSTNIQSGEFTINCLNCGSPVDMELGSKSTAFVSVAFSEMYKQRGTKKR